MKKRMLQKLQSKAITLRHFKVKIAGGKKFK